MTLPQIARFQEEASRRRKEAVAAAKRSKALPVFDFNQHG